MPKRALVACLLGLCPVVIACGSLVPPPQNSMPQDLDTPAAFALWPHVSGRVGSYDIQTASEVTDMAADGLTVLLKGFSTPSPMATAVSNSGVNIIDSYPWSLIETYGCSDYFARKSSSCRISAATSNWILSQLQAHLAAQQGNDNVIAYWFLDDYPGGDVSALLQQMHDLLVASNSDPLSAFPRPAICGFGGQILPLNDTNITDAAPLMSYFNRAVTNFRPSYCDLVALYPYAANNGAGPNDPSQYDWSMTYLLPVMFEKLEDAGWDSSKEPLIGMPQTFGYLTYVAPTGVDIVTQMTAYCKAGAVALLVYSWDDGYPSAYPESPSTEPANSADMRAGLGQGLTQCRSFWPRAVASGLA